MKEKRSDTKNRTDYRMYERYVRKFPKKNSTLIDTNVNNSEEKNFYLEKFHMTKTNCRLSNRKVQPVRANK